MSELNPGIMNIPTPDRIKSLPVGPNGFYVPWFVAWVDGKPEFRMADGAKRGEAVRARKCWVCGDYLGKHMAFLIGPMCAVNRVSAEPPSHRECAEYSVRACPFLARPMMERREGGLPEGGKCDGEMIRRNPGVTLIWMTRSYRVIPEGKGGWLIRVGEPDSVTAYREGRFATADEVRESVESGLPILESSCRFGHEREELARMVRAARAVLGIAAAGGAAA